MASARAQAAAEQEAAVARCRSSAAAALDNVGAHAENRCERLEEGFVRERDRAAVAELVLADWGTLVFAHLHKPVVEDEEESDRWRSKLTPCILVEVTMGPAGVWERCCGVVPLFRFTGSNRPSVVHVRRSIDIDFCVLPLAAETDGARCCTRRYDDRRLLHRGCGRES